MTDADSSSELVSEDRSDVSTHLESAVTAELERRDAVAVVHAGFRRDPTVRYCLSAGDDGSPPTDRHRAPTAVAYDGTSGEWLTVTSTDTSAAPARELASQLADRQNVESGTVLAPPWLPHDAALYLEEAGFELASTTVFDDARATKTDGERDRIATAQTAAAAGLRRAASLLTDATVEGDRLVADGEAVTPRRLRTAVDEGIVAAGAFPAGNTAVNPDPGHTPSTNAADADGDTADVPLRPAEPIVLETTPRGPDGYYGSLTRTFVVDGEGGRERRAHVGVTQSFRSAAAMVTADVESVTAVEADLEAEVRAFGFEEPDAVRTRAFGVGLEPQERPMAGGDEIEPGSAVRLESAVRVDGDQWLRIADLLVPGDDGERAAYLVAPSRSLAPSALLEE
ncbi:M24 family metallopeptidase [Natronolimnohabitans sp. A-GB9]|uniref:M24 family metallopeptidase n=1 Tax=Natronolimnohabitans sp. A-GB9 TaxID=3069757 RepID=UPI0027B51374|nr:M24 family metallopeptidase [Natronolimnohabitans sp. A-GB9]MDQ2050527.1 M24 family metallopeptidase [Natronolimnohabitans sp. A-GB9]